MKLKITEREKLAIPGLLKREKRMLFYPELWKERI